MTHLYEELIDVLEKELSLCVQLIELLQKEKDVIASLNPKSLELLLCDKELITAKIRVCDEMRDRILNSLGFKGKTITEIAKDSEGIYKDRLSDIASRFTAAIQSISELNRFNRLLIEKSLYYIKTSYNFLHSFDITPKQKVSMEA